MRFFEISGYTQENCWATDHGVMREKARMVSVLSKKFNGKLKDRGFFFVASAADGVVDIGVIQNKSMETERLAKQFAETIDIRWQESKLEEITFDNICSMLSRADRFDFIGDNDEILEKFGLDELRCNRGDYMQFEEDLLEPLSKEEVYREAENYLFRDRMNEELDRIYAGSKLAVRYAGHPAHYLLQADDGDVKGKMVDVLLGALSDQHRIENKRYSILTLSGAGRFSRRYLNAIYRSSVGGTVVIDYIPGDTAETDYASAGRRIVRELCEAVKNHRNDVLTVLVLPRDCERTVSMFYEYLETLTIVKVAEDPVFGVQARNFLKQLAKGTSLRPDKKLYSAIQDNTGYLTPELKSIFGAWYNCKLKQSVFPQYKDLSSANTAVKTEKPKGSAFDDLMEMTGLEEAKRVIVQAVNYHKAQRLFASKGMKAERPSMHMVFTGNPGTAKTSVARLFARIMLENGLLSGGQLVEVGRGDLVGQYVGWTAPTIKKKFEEAKGGVLFIDEAYSLVDDRDGSFGDEAINTIVQEMENHREDVAVIFAGYPEKMEKFLQKNPGLRSRIAFHVKFEDYDTEDLCKIAQLIAKKKGLSIDEGAEKKLRLVFDKARKTGDFGNGRYVRNVVEKAKMAQAVRLLDMDYDHVSKKDISTILAEDIEIPKEANVTERKVIGFC